MNIRIVILAAGKGKRMGTPDLPKVLHEIGGRPMLSYVIDAVKRSGVDAKPVVVIGHMGDRVKAVCGDACEYAVQEELNGTGDAVARTRPLLEGSADHVMVLVGDQPLVSPETIRSVAESHLASGATVTLGTVTVEDFEGWRASFADFGRIVRAADGKFAAIVEKKDAAADQLTIHEVNPSYYCFQAPWLWKALKTLTNLNAQGEYYLTDLPGKALAEGEAVTTVAIPPAEAMGVNTTSQLAIIEDLMRTR
jgi:bifunctional UDP-N-acetylglucosamine pyrophosphorylase/glucosamine-1-phosphate N-acetyltransferase